jgi:hypothetical protein
VRDVGAALDQQGQAPFERIERGADIDVVALKEILDAGAGGADRRRDREIALDQIGNSRRQRLGLRVVRDRQQARGDLADRPRADRFDAAPVEISLDQAFSLFRRVGIELGEKIPRKSFDDGRGHRAQAAQLGAECVGTPELREQAGAPALGNIDRVEQRREQAKVADPQPRGFQAGGSNRLQHPQHHLGVGLAFIGLAEGLDASLAKLARMGGRAAAGLIAEYRAVVAVARHAVALWMALKIDAHGRHGDVRPEAQRFAVLIGEDVGAGAQPLADDIEKQIGRLNDRRRDALVVRLVEHGHDDRGLRFERLEAVGCLNGHD